MRRNKIYIFFYAFLITEITAYSLSYPQIYLSGEDFTGTGNYAESPLMKGLPEIEPGKNFPLKMDNASFAWLNPIAGFQALYFIKGVSQDKKVRYFILTVSSDAGYALSPISITNNTGNNIFGYAVLNHMGEYSYSFPLRINYSVSDNSIKYSWPSNINTNGTAGISTIIPVIKIGDNFSNKFSSALEKNFPPNLLKNKIIVLNFGTPVSSICRQSLSEFDSLYSEYADNPGIIFVSVGTGEHDGSINGNYYSIKKWPSTRSALGEVFPLNIVLDSSGTVIYSKLGYEKSLFGKIDSVLKKYKSK